jgi:death-on-curing protein
LKSRDLRYLTSDEIIQIHEEIIKGDPLSFAGIQSYGNIVQAAKRPQISISKPKNEEFIPYPDIYSKAAALLEALCQRHGFNDGNKRTGFIATSIFLALNGYYLIPVIYSVRFTIAIADKKVKTDLNYARKWIKRHTSRYRSIANFRLRLHNLWLVLLIIFGGMLLRKYVERKIDYWMAFDIDPRYKEEWMKRMEYWARRQRNNNRKD